MLDIRILNTKVLAVLVLISSSVYGGTTYRYIGHIVPRHIVHSKKNVSAVAICNRSDFDLFVSTNSSMSYQGWMIPKRDCCSINPSNDLYAIYPEIGYGSAKITVEYDGDN